MDQPNTPDIPFRAIRAARMRVKRALQPLEISVAQALCSLSIKIASWAHYKLFDAQWAYGPTPEHFDHHIDLYRWLATRNPLGWERGVFGNLVLQGGDVLELACGDGFNARNFYSLRSRKVVACDFDPSALKTACAKNSAPNVEYVLADIRTHMPQGQFANVIWDAAIEHFTPAETQQILKDIRARMLPGAVLSGYTITGKGLGGTALRHHEYEFLDKQDLLRVIEPHFKHVTVFETIYPTRHNLYFWASDTPLPFQPGWPHSVSKA